MPVLSQTALAHIGAQHVTAPTPQSRSSRDSAMAQFLDQARTATEQFHDRRAAIANGYRRLGMDFPSMGEHWVNPGIVLAGRFDASRPAMLSYAVIDGKPVLTGLVYAVTLAPGEAPPPVPGDVGMWHEHNGTVDEESMLPEHHGDGAGQHITSSDTAGTRLAILHAWTGVVNPAGIFAAENWALPFARLRLATPMPLPLGAARALSLLTGGREYYLALANADQPDANRANSDPVSIALDECARVEAPIIARARATGVLAPSDVAQLEAAWNAALSRIASEVGPLVAKRLNGGHEIISVTSPKQNPAQ
ncbi:MAG: hypothetical protein ACR2M1_14095 [Gemmatimonadaceae bacterium]